MFSNKGVRAKEIQHKSPKREKNGVFSRVVDRLRSPSSVKKGSLKGSLKRKELAKSISNSRFDLEELMADGFFLDVDIDDKDKVYVALLKELDQVLEQGESDEE
jgi:hypothetical protein